jgi:hypothetical protein
LAQAFRVARDCPLCRSSENLQGQRRQIKRGLPAVLRIVGDETATGGASKPDINHPND